MPFFDPIRIGASASGTATAYSVDRSLRFNDDDSAYLARTPSSASNRKTWTLSYWVKRGNITSNQGIFGAESSGDRLVIGFGNGGSDQARFYSQSPAADLYTNRLFRDVSSWYHIVWAVDTTQATASNRIKLYVNGTQETSFDSASYPSQDSDLSANNTVAQYVGRWAGYDGEYFDGYIAEMNLIDGQQLTPSSFGETNSDTGQWNPIDTSGLTFGTNGFRLNFADNSGTTATTLGKDLSGNSNNFTPNNFVTGDAVKDSPTNNFATMSPLAVSGDGNHPTFSQGNLKTMGPNSGIGKVGAAFGLSSGKWYVEAKITQGGSNLQLGIIFSGTNYANNEYLGSGSDYAIAADTYNKKIRKEGSDNQTSLGGMQDGDILAFAIDMDNGTFQLYNNGSTKGSQVSFTVANYAPVTFGQTTGYNTVGTHWNFGADSSFAGAVTAQGNTDGNSQGDFYYSPPSGFLAVCSANLPDPTILLPNKHFDTLLYSGNGSQNRAITGLNFKPDWVWLKSRTNTYFHQLHDVVRGTSGGVLYSNNTNAEDSTYGLGSFDSNGFTVYKDGNNDAQNDSGQTYVAWNWNAGDTDSKTYTVTVVDSGGNKYRFDGFAANAVTLRLAKGGTYIFNYPSAHPFRFSATSDGTHGGGSEYTTGVTVISSTSVQIVVDASAPVLYYYCTQHSGMGGQIDTNTDLGSSNFDGTTQSLVKVNQTAGFSIVLYTGNGNTSASTTIGHGLGVSPDVIITKKQDSAGTDFGWSTWHHKLLHSSYGQDVGIWLDKNNGQNADMWDGYSNFSSTVFTPADLNYNNVNNSTYINYVFSEVAGYSKFGKYTGNGQASSGPFVFTGFRPAWIIIKGFVAIDWVIDDATRSPFNESNATLFSNLSDAEYTGGAYGIDILSNGFKPYNSYTQYNQNGTDYIYLAFAESPFKNARAR